MLAAIFDRFKNEDPGRIPEQYNVSRGTHEYRMELDTAFLKALGIQVAEADLLSLYENISSSLTQWLGK
jgi:hypothetical protein